MAYKIPSHRQPSRPTAFVLGALGNGTVIYNKNDYRIMPNGEQGHGTSRVIDRHSQVDLMKSQLLRYLSQELQIKRGAKIIAIDCGANYGMHTITMAQATYPHGTVHAFEPQEWVYYCLCGNMALNNLHNARAYKFALGDKTGTIKIKVPDPLKPASYGSFGLDPAWNIDVGQNNEQMVEQTVQLYKFDDLTYPRVDLIKLDIEGLEAAFIRGASETLAKFKPVLLIEYLKGDRAALVSTLEQNNYTCRRYSQEQDILAWHKEDTVATEIIDRLVSEEPLELGYTQQPAPSPATAANAQQGKITIQQIPPEQKKPA